MAGLRAAAEARHAHSGTADAQAPPNPEEDLVAPRPSRKGIRPGPPIPEEAVGSRRLNLLQPAGRPLGCGPGGRVEFCAPGRGALGAGTDCAKRERPSETPPPRLPRPSCRGKAQGVSRRRPDGSQGRRRSNQRSASASAGPGTPLEGRTAQGEAAALPRPTARRAPRTARPADVGSLGRAPAHAQPLLSPWIYLFLKDFTGSLRSRWGGGSAERPAREPPTDSLKHRPRPGARSPRTRTPHPGRSGQAPQSRLPGRPRQDTPTDLPGQGPPRAAPHSRAPRPAGRSRGGAGRSPPDKGGADHAHGAGPRPEARACARARRLGNGNVCAGLFRKPESGSLGRGERPWGRGRAETVRGGGPGPPGPDVCPTLLWGVFRRRVDPRAESGGGRGSPSSAGAQSGKQLHSRAPLSASRSEPGSGRRHKGKAVRTAQARKPLRLLGAVVRPPNGRGFLVVGAWKELSVLAPPPLHLDWPTEGRLLPTFPDGPAFPPDRLCFQVRNS
ncbi:translation initiation factor IF-2-like [Meles meles]|uniref:translation initiation factor IF-2-like n=1 Tax=Meles meles TaxID=9662 RepID=UPI001E69F51B|nr:translation initiation factor IF-2-like [Meles meles]